MSTLLQSKTRPGMLKPLGSTPGSDWLTSSSSTSYGDFTGTPAMTQPLTPANGPTFQNAAKQGPVLGGGWMEGAGLGLQAANVGLGIYSALEQSKMNKFMRGYYGNEMARNKVDFNNNVTSTNAALEKQARTSASQNGFAFGSTENQAATAEAMNKWGVQKFE